MTRRVLFVDDDANLLKALRRMLWNKPGWDVAFATSGQEALAALEAAPCDVVVADMRMPGMDGQQLLEAVRVKHPWTMRVILSGDSDRDYIMRSVRVAHQFLTKPVSAERLGEIIDRGCALREALLSQELKALAGGIESLPPLPAAYDRLVGELAKETASVDSLAEIISRDVALSADVLKLVNSSFFGPRLRVRRLSQAVTLLGTQINKGLVLGVQLLKAFDVRRFPNFDFGRLWDHCLATGRMARAIAEVENMPPEEQDDCFIAGMLHDVGKLVLAEKLSPRYVQVVDAARRDNIPILQAERRELGADHALLGAHLLGLWGMGDTVMEAVAFHHDISRLGRPGMCPAVAVHAANALNHQLVVLTPGYADHPLDTAALETLGLPGREDAWREACAALLDQME